MPHDPTRRSLRTLFVLGAFLALPLLAACDDSDDDDDDDDDGMGARPAAVLMVSQ